MDTTRVNLRELHRMHREQQQLPAQEGGAQTGIQPVGQLSSGDVERLFAKWKQKMAAENEQKAPSTVEAVPDVLCQRLHTNSVVRFPNGEIAQGAWEFGLMGSLTEQERLEIVDIIAKRAFDRLLRALPDRAVMMVCFGSAMHACGKRAAALLVEQAHLDVHVILADGYYSPRIWWAPKELTHKTVVLLVDVVRSGGLLARLKETCATECPARIVPVTVIDQSSDNCAVGDVIGLWKEDTERRLSPESAGIQGKEIRYFDPELSYATEVVYEDPGCGHVNQAADDDVTGFGELLPFIEKTNALETDEKIYGVQYPWVLDLLRLMKDKEATDLLVKRAVGALTDLRETGKWCIVYPAGRFKRAGIWAELLAASLHWDVMPVGLADRNQFRPLTDMQCEKLRSFAGIAVADAAIRTGETLRSFVYLARLACGKTTHMIGLYAFDALTKAIRDKIEGELDISVRSAYRFPLGPPTESVQAVCRNLLQNILQEVEQDSLTADGESWKIALAEYCRRRLATHRSFPPGETPASENIAQALAEFHRGPQARLEQCSVRARPGIVKHLDVHTALSNPRVHRAIHAFLCNSMPAEFIEWCGLALSCQHDFGWFDRDWLTLHRGLLCKPDSRRWEFLLCVTYLIKKYGTDASVRQAIHGIQQVQPPDSSRNGWLFKLPQIGKREPFEERRNTLLSVLS